MPTRRGRSQLSIANALRYLGRPDVNPTDSYRLVDIRAWLLNNRQSALSASTPSTASLYLRLHAAHVLCTVHCAPNADNFSASGCCTSSVVYYGVYYGAILALRSRPFELPHSFWKEVRTFFRFVRFVRFFTGRTTWYSNSQDFIIPWS